MTHAKDDLPISHANELAEAIAKDLRQMIKNAEIWGAEQVLAALKGLHITDPSGDWCNHCWTGPDTHGNGNSPEYPCDSIKTAHEALEKIKNNE